jgi:iron complex transport system permease protein
MTDGPKGWRRGLPFAAAAAAACAAGALSLLSGSIRIPPASVIAALLGSGDASTLAIVREIRLPRTLLGLLVGGALAMSGASLQALLQNPLADPFLLGVSGGAACGALVGALLSASSATGPSILFGPVAAFLGALAAVALVGAGASVRGRLDRNRLLLAGVVVNALASAVLLFLLSFGNADQTRGFVFWMLGSLAGATRASVSSMALYAAGAGLVLVGLSRSLDALTLGDDTAFTLGIRVERTKRIAYVSASLLAAAAVASAGIIGFVGLLVPNAVRLVARGHVRILVLSFLTGAALLVVSDVAARTLFSPAEVAVGAVTALLGAPAFLILLRQRG